MPPALREEHHGLLLIRNSAYTSFMRNPPGDFGRAALNRN